MQRLAKPSDYVLQDILGRSMYVLPWESMLCPGNPGEDPETGAEEYNAHALVRAQKGDTGAIHDPVGDSVDSALKTPGEAYRALASDLAEAFLGKYQFSLDDLEHWDEETKSIRGALTFCNAALRELPARQVMALRVRAAQA